MTTRPLHRIAVIGAGPGGLTCARVLQRHGFAVTVHDRDTSADSRDQGGTLDLHADSGQIALREAGLHDAFLALSRPEGQAKRIMTSRGEVLADHRPGPEEDAAPEIDRGQLRSLLAESLAPGTVHWGHTFTGAAPRGDGTQLLSFADGSTSVADLVVGADGAWSRVRPLVSDARPRHTGVTFVEAHFDDVDEAHPALADLVGHGHVSATADNKGLMAQRSSDHVRAYIALRTGPDREWAAGADPADTTAVRAALLQAFAGWDERLLALITDNDGPYVERPLFVLPSPHTWPHTPGVTLLGDAAHLMTPFGGMGANLAMLDGCELALAVAAHPDLDAAVTAYERTMGERAAEATRGDLAVLDRVFSPGERDPASLPDFAAEKARYRRAAGAYRAARAAAPVRTAGEEPAVS